MCLLISVSANCLLMRAAEWVLFSRKAATMRDFVMAGQHEFKMRRAGSDGLESEVESKEVLDEDFV